MKKFLIILSLLALTFSCTQNPQDKQSQIEFEFVLVDSLVTDLLEPIRILDYHHDKQIYLAVKFPSLEGQYYLLDKEGNIIAENQLSEGPDAFGLVLLRAGFVGDEILFLSERNGFIYNLNFEQLRKYPFQQDVRFRLIHMTQDNLSTYKTAEGNIKAVVNLNDAHFQPYPEDYYDTLHMVHLMDMSNGEITKGGKLLENSMFRSGKFFPVMDKPVFFSDLNSKYISTILYGDSLLYQIDPTKDFSIVNTIKLDRIGNNKMISIPMSQASITSVREYRSDNITLGGRFDEIVGYGNEMLVGYKTGTDPALIYENPDEEMKKAEIASRKRYYYYIDEGKQIGKPIPWTLPGQLTLNVGKNRYIQYADQAEIHDFEKDYQCYYIYELREKK